MIKSFSQRPGFLFLEVLLGIAVFAIFIASVGLTILLGQETTIGGGDRTRALTLTEEALEGTRAIRDASFSSLRSGVFGVRVGSGGTWVFSGSGTTTSDGYRTSVTLAASGTGLYRVTGRTVWKHGRNRTGSVVLTTDVTEWRSPPSVGDWRTVTVEGTYTATGPAPLFTDAAVSGNYAYVSTNNASGPGLYVFDISTLAAPTRVSSTFTISAPVYQLAIRGTALFMAVGDSSREIQAYDISSPTSLTSSDRIDYYGLPGSSRARSLIIAGTTLYVGAITSGSSGQDEFYSFNISNPADIRLIDSLNDTGSHMDIALSSTAAYVASSQDTSELRLIDVEDPANLRFAAGGGFNVTDVQDGSAVSRTGTATLLGRRFGSAIEELVLFDVARNPLPSPPPGPWYRDIVFTGSDGVNGMSTDSASCYAFVASDLASAEFQVVSIRDFLVTQVSTYNLTAGPARNAVYDPARDRVYLLTPTEFIILRPNSPPGPCP